VEKNNEDEMLVKPEWLEVRKAEVVEIIIDGVTLLENFLWKCSMGYTLYPWISLLEPTLETSYKPQT